MALVEKSSVQEYVIMLKNKEIPSELLLIWAKNSINSLKSNNEPIMLTLLWIT